MGYGVGCVGDEVHEDVDLVLAALEVVDAEAVEGYVQDAHVRAVFHDGYECEIAKAVSHAIWEVVLAAVAAVAIGDEGDVTGHWADGEDLEEETPEGAADATEE